MSPPATKSARDPKLVQAVESLPAPDPAAAQHACRQILDGGAPWIEQLVAMVGEPGDDKGVKPRYAVHALAAHVARPKANPKERKLLAATLARQLDADHSPEVKAFLIEQLQLAATPDEVPALAKWIADKRLGQPAVSALIAIGDERAVEALRKALPPARGRLRVAIIQGLGRLRDKPSVPDLLKAAADKDRDIRLAALYALANIGAPEAIPIVQAAAAVDPGYERTQGVDACLLLAQRLREQDREKEAEAICQHLLDTHKAPEEEHVRRAARKGLRGKAK